MNEKRVKCSWCDERMAPLKLSNMLVDDSYNVQVVCSYCIVSKGAQKRFQESGVKDWPERFTERKDEMIQAGFDLVTLAVYVAPWVLFGLAIWGLVFKGVSL